VGKINKFDKINKNKILKRKKKRKIGDRNYGKKN